MQDRLNTTTTTRHFRFALTGAAAVLALAPPSHAADQTWDGGGTGGGTAWLTPANWVGDAAFPGSQTVTTNTDTGTFTTAGTANTIGINFNFTGNTFYLGAVNVTGNVSRSIGNSSGTAGTLVLNGATVNSVANVILRNSGTSTLTLAKTQTGAMNVVLGNATANVVNVDSSGNVVISSDVSGTGRVLTVNTASTGDLRLSGTNTYTGGTNVTGGTGGGRLRVDMTASLPSTGTVAVSTGGRITLNVAGTYGGTSQALTFNPNQTINPSLDILSDAAVVWQGTVALNADTRLEANGTGSLTFSGNLSGSGTLIKQAAGNLILSGTGNTATGGTQVGNGTLTVNSGSNLGTGNVTLFQTGTNNTALTFNNATQNIGNLSSQFTATTGTQTQTVTLNGTALTINQTANTSFGTGNVSTLTSTITGSGSIALASTSTGTLTLTGANTYTGTTNISGGTLTAGAANALQSTSRITVNTGGTLLLAGTGDRIGNAAPITLNGGAFNTGGLTERVGALTLSATSGVDLGAGVGGTLTFGGTSTRTAGALAFTNYDAGDHVFFYNASTGTTAYTLDSTFLSAITINGLGVQELSTGEIVPVPEPATILAGLLALGTLGVTQRRRVRGWLAARRARLPLAA